MSPTRLALAALTACALAPTLAAAADLPILPGWWRWDSQMAVLSGKHEMRCLRPHDINKVLTGAINHHYTCNYSTADIAGGRARLEGVCVDKHGGTIPISLKGVYTSTSFNMTGRFQVPLGGMRLPVTGKIDARRLAETCPAGPDSQPISSGG